MSRCYQCRRPGILIGLWYSPVRRALWLRFWCESCPFFRFRTCEGKERIARPTWMMPEREYRP